MDGAMDMTVVATAETDTLFEKHETWFHAFFVIWRLLANFVALLNAYDTGEKRQTVTGTQQTSG